GDPCGDLRSGYTSALTGIYRCGIYAHGICVRHSRGAEPTGHLEPPGHVGEVRRRARTAARDAPALRVEAPPGAARGRFRGFASRCAAPRLSAPARTLHGAGLVARPVPAILVGACGCARAPPGPHGTTAGTE